MTGTADAIVVGAGIVGAACAAALAEAGVRVHVLERGRPGNGTTAAGMGHVLVLDDTEAQLALTRLSRDLWNAIEWPPAVERDPCGTIWIASDDEEIAMARAKAAWLADRGVSSEVLDAAALEEAEPQLRPGRGGLLVPEDSVVYAPAATEHLLARAESSGATVDLGVAVRAAGDGYILLADGTRLEAGHVVVAAGLASCGLVDPPPALAIRPKRGHLAITARAPGFVRHQLLELGYLASAHGAAATSIAFNVQPRATGQVLLGSSRQLDEEDPAVDLSIVARMIDRGREFIPGLADLPVIRTWVGSRPATVDNLPLIGPLPGRPRLLLAAGHEGVGITTSLGTARLVVDHVLARSSPIDPAPYAARRIAGEEVA